RPDVHGGWSVAQTRRIHPSVFDRLPRELEHDPLLRVHLPRLTWRDPEESRVESIHVPQEAAPPRIHLSGRPGVAVKQRIDIPALRRHLLDDVAAFSKQRPKRLRRVDTSR